MFDILGQIIVALLGGILGVGVMLILLRNYSFSSRHKYWQDRFKRKMNKSLKTIVAQSKSKEDNILHGTQYYLSKRAYNIVRYILFFLAGILSLINLNFTVMIFTIMIFVITIPQEVSKKGKRLPFFYFPEIFRKIEREKKDMELLGAMSLLKNLLVQQRHNPLGADYIIDYLASDARLTKPAYLKMLNYLRLSRKEDAINAFIQDINTDISKDIAGLLIQLDHLNPAELEEAIISRQNFVREVKHTKNKKKDELISDLIYVPILVTVIIVLVNFVMIGYIIDQKDLLTLMYI